MSTTTTTAPTIHRLACAVLAGSRSVISLGADDLLRTWDLSTGKESRPRIHVGNGGHFALSVTEIEGRPLAITGDAAGSISFWDLETSRRAFGPLEGHPEAVTDACVVMRGGRPIVLTRSPAELAYDGEGAYGYGGAILAWDPTSGERRGEAMTAEHLGIIRGSEMALVVTSHAKAHIYFDHGEVGALFEGHHDRMIVDAALALDHASAGDGGTGGGDPRVVTADPFCVWLWSARTGAPHGGVLSAAQPSGRARIVGLATTPDGRAFVARRGGMIEVWDLRTRQRLAERPATAAPIAAMTVDDDGTVVTGHDDGAISIHRG